MPFAQPKFILPPQKAVRKILILAHSNIGDIATDSLLLKPLKRQYPDAKIYFLTSARAKEIAACYSGVDEFIIIDKKSAHKGFLGRWRLHRQLAREKFDLGIALIKTFEHIFLRPRFVWDVRRKFSFYYKHKAMHPIDIYLKFLKSAGLPLEEPWFDFNLAGEEAFCDSFLKSKGVLSQDTLVGILPLAAWGIKNWPIKKFNELAVRLEKESGLKTIAFGKTGGDKDFIGRDVLENILPSIILAINQTTLKQSLALIRKCKFFIGPDSSLLHVASNLKVETIGLYGPTPPDYVYPYFHRSNLIVAKGFSSRYICSKNPYACACKEEGLPSPCMDSIRVEDVFNMLQGKLSII